MSNPPTEIIYGEVVAKANHYMAVPAADGQNRIIKDEVIRNYEKSFLSQCKIYRNKLIAKPFYLVADVFYCSERKDIDNSLKTMLDGLQYAKAITDDNLCYQIRATKHIDRRRPRVEYSIIELEPTLF